MKKLIQYITWPAYLIGFLIAAFICCLASEKWVLKVTGLTDSVKI